MLKDSIMFKTVESILKENGTIGQFESENGQIRGRMMISLGEIPQSMGIEKTDDIIAFVGSFDFYDAEIGIALKKDTYEPVTQIWVTPQRADAEKPMEEWIEFFVQTLAQNIGTEGFGIPMYTFMSEEAAFTVVPDAKE